VLDNIVVYGGYLVLCALLRWSVGSIDHLFLLLLATIAYHFALEARDGQTVGKRIYGIRAVSVDARPITPRAAAVRSAVRVFDLLPVWYVSGLLSMVRTGPDRRQRIGDLAAGTMVVAVDGRAARKGTPGWLLYAATLVAFLVSVGSVYALTQAGKEPLSSAQQSQFIAGCERGVGAQIIDCRCLLSQLQADGYVTLNSLRNLAFEAESEQLRRTPGAASREMMTAARDCRRSGG
jgi:uncharacterized RDD family membrane protein YckC